MNNTCGAYVLKKRLATAAGALFRFIFIFGVAYIILEPLFTKLSMSLMTQVDLYDKSVKFIPKHFTLNNFGDAIRFLDYWPALFNTTALCVLSGVLQAVSCAAVGYGFGFFEFKGKRILFALVIVTMVVPPQLILTPLYLNFQNFTLFGLIPLFNGGKGVRLIESFVPFVALSITAVGSRNGLYIFLARQSFRGMPKEISESAAIDGAGPFRVFWRVMLPGALPVMTAIFLFSFVWQWNDSFYSFLFYSDLKTVARMLTTIAHQFTMMTSQSSAVATNLGYLSIMQATSALLAILPPALLYAVFQKRFIQSIERTGIVG
ncbi:MAG: carbohydrate ABC transporter permease [Clostridiales bacterium]|jgi:multiple sugar transport system permease protein|nr:carbohydrate ABC transporter permease [Clostridiales bacterium]